MTLDTTPERITDEKELERLLTTPRPELIEDLRTGSGDLVILGAGGKMGPSLARLARAGLDAAGRTGDTVHAVSRFPDERLRRDLAESGVRVVPFDLIESDNLSTLPDGTDVIHLVGAKFGVENDQSWAWEVNAALPDRVTRRYRTSRLVALSTGNVYPFVTPDSGGATEETPGLRRNAHRAIHAVQRAHQAQASAAIGLVQIQLLPRIDQVGVANVVDIHAPQFRSAPGRAQKQA